MRIWDVDPRLLCRKHLLGEHRELHALWTILTQHKKGYSKHPETLRWIGKLNALYSRHDLLVAEMTARGYSHKTDLNKMQAVGKNEQDKYLNSIKEQFQILKSKNCECLLQVADLVEI